MKSIAVVSSPGSGRALGNGLQRARVTLEVVHWRHGWLWSAGLALLAGALILEVTQNRPLGLELSAVQRGPSPALIASAASRPVQSLADGDEAGRGRAMEVLLGAQGSFESQYQRLIDIAGARGIELPRAAYVTTWDEAGGLRRVQVSLLMVVRYPQFRSFIEEALRTLPTVSLDQFAVKRENIAQAQVDVAVQLSFWSQVPPMQPAPKVAVPSAGS